MAFRFSLYEKFGNSAVAVMLTIAAIAFTYPAAISLNIQDVTEMMNNYDTLVNVCVIIILESILLLLLVTNLLKAHFDNSSVTWSKGIVLFPSISGMFGIFISLVYVLNCISGLQLGLPAFVSLAAALIALLLFQLGIRSVLSWQLRLDFVLILSFIEIIIAMFLPLVVKGTNVPVADNHNLGRDFFFGLLSFGSLAIVSVLVQLFVNKIVGVIKI